MSYLDLLQALRNAIQVSKAKLPALMAWLDQTLALLEIDAPPRTEQVYFPSAEESAIEGEIAQALTAEGTQAVWDGSRLRRLVELANQAAGMAPTIITLIKLLSGVAG